MADRAADTHFSSAGSESGRSLSLLSSPLDLRHIAPPGLIFDSLQTRTLRDFAACPRWFTPSHDEMTAAEFSAICRFTAAENERRISFPGEPTMQSLEQPFTDFLDRRPGAPYRAGSLVLVPWRPNGKLFVAFDIHEDFEACTAALRATNFFERVRDGEDCFFAFAGDYINRGTGGLHVLSELFQHYTHPLFGDRVFLLKGNHESDRTYEWSPPGESVVRKRDFFTTIERRIATHWAGSSAVDLWNTSFNAFDTLPLSLVTASGATIVHGGVGEVYRGTVKYFKRKVTDDLHLARLFAHVSPTPGLIREFLDLRYSHDPRESKRKRPDREFVDLSDADQIRRKTGSGLLLRGHQLEVGASGGGKNGEHLKGFTHFGNHIFTGHTVTKGSGNRSYADAVVVELPLDREVQSVSDIKVHTVLERAR